MLTTEYIIKAGELVEVPVRKNIKYSKYLQSEIQFIHDNWQSKTVKQIADDLARTVRSVEVCARKLGLKKVPNWTDEEIKYLVEHHHRYRTSCLAKVLCKSENAVKIKKTRLGLCKRTKNTPVKSSMK